MFNIQLILGDITQIEVDAIVNAANSSLLGGGGVDGAIHRAGGPQILEDCKSIRNRQGSCKTGEAVVTSAGKLKAKHVIHTVGPVWNGGHKNEAGLLANCYRNSIRIAKDLGLTSIAFPGISTGIYRFPKELAAEIAFDTCNSELQAPGSLQKLIFVCFDQQTYELYEKLLASQAKD